MSTARVRRVLGWAAAAVLTGALFPVVAAAQRRAAPRAQTPAAAPAATPQLVTVRAREPLRFDAQVLVPQYYDRSFWPDILVGLEVAPPAPPARPAATAAPAAAPALPASRGGVAPPRARRPARAPR